MPPLFPPVPELPVFPREQFGPVAVAAAAPSDGVPALLHEQRLDFVELLVCARFRRGHHARQAPVGDRPRVDAPLVEYAFDVRLLPAFACGDRPEHFHVGRDSGGEHRVGIHIARFDKGEERCEQPRLRKQRRLPQRMFCTSSENNQDKASKG